MNFNATAVLIRKMENMIWLESYVAIDSVDDIRKLFEPFQDNVTQVNLDINRKIYYSSSFIKDNIEALATDSEGEKHYMVSPLLFVQCDSEKPVVITNDTLKSIKDEITFY